MFPTNASYHVCHLFGTRCEQIALASTFLRGGLTADEACIVLTAPQTVDDWYTQIQIHGMDVELERRRGTLAVIAGGQQRVPGYLNSIVRAGELLEFVAVRAQFAGVRILADVGWGFDPRLQADLLCHWEATADLALADLNVRTVCQYDVRRDSPSALLAALRTHPIVMLRQRLYRSPFFEARRILQNEPHLNHSVADANQVKLMLRQLRAHAVSCSSILDAIPFTH